MKKRNFDEWLSKFRPSISSYDYYIDFEKVVRNVEKIKIELNILNSLIVSNSLGDCRKDMQNFLLQELVCRLSFRNILP